MKPKIYDSKLYKKFEKIFRSGQLEILKYFEEVVIQSIDDGYAGQSNGRLLHIIKDAREKIQNG